MKKLFYIATLALVTCSIFKQIIAGSVCSSCCNVDVQVAPNPAPIVVHVVQPQPAQPAQPAQQVAVQAPAPQEIKLTAAEEKVRKELEAMKSYYQNIIDEYEDFLPETITEIKGKIANNSIRLGILKTELRAGSTTIRLLIKNVRDKIDEVKIKFPILGLAPLRSSQKKKPATNQKPAWK